VTGQFIFIPVGFLRGECTELDLNLTGKTPEAMDRCTTRVMVGRELWMHFQRIFEGIGITSQSVSWDSLINLEISSKAAGGKTSKGEGMWAEENCEMNLK
jgi:hypothetical protein